MKRIVALILGVLILIAFLPSCESIDEPNMETITTDIIEYYGAEWGRESFYNYEELRACIDGVDTLGYSFYYLNVDGMITNQYPKDRIFFRHKENSTGADFIISISAAIYDETVGYDKELVEGAPALGGYTRKTFSMAFYAYPFKYDGGEFSYKIFKYDVESSYDYVVFVYYKEEIVCKLFYYSKLNLSLSCFEDLFDRKGIIICNEEEK